MNLNTSTIARTRKYWSRHLTQKPGQVSADFLGHPTAEIDSKIPEWFEHILIKPLWFDGISRPNTSLVIGRKGSGKTAARIASVHSEHASDNTVLIEVSADELVARHAARFEQAAARGFGAVADWCAAYTEIVVRHIANDLSEHFTLSQDEDLVRKWANQTGVTERDFTGRITNAVASILPWAKKALDERGGISAATDERFSRLASARRFCLFIDDFDNIQENVTFKNIRLIRDAVEAADRITQNGTSRVRLFMREDLWLRIRPGWHYADKITTGLVEANWTQDELRKWLGKRLQFAIAKAVGEDPAKFASVPFNELWGVFYPENIRLSDGRTSAGFHYIIRRTMYTPRTLQHALELIVKQAKKFPATTLDVEQAEEAFSKDHLEFLSTEFANLCTGLSVCLQSFTGKTSEWIPSDLYKHLKGLLGNGQVKLHDGVSTQNDSVDLARFLYRIGFLEVRYKDGDRFETRDALRQPEHWRSIRTDDSIRWKVRSAFYFALMAHRTQWIHGV